MGKALDLTNERFGSLVAIRLEKYVPNSGNFWLCRCDCGKECSVVVRSLRYGSTRSCGCLSKANYFKRTHGFTSRRVHNEKVFHRKWCSMFQRCYNPKNKSFKDYGGRGIVVVKRWHKFENFRDDMYTEFVSHFENHGSRNTQLERRDNNASYSRENCLFTTSKKQMRNRRKNRLITFNGETKCISEWSEERGLSVPRIASRLRRGDSIERALSPNDLRRTYEDSMGGT